jgi:hypothetical protein
MSDEASSLLALFLPGLSNHWFHFDGNAPSEHQVVNRWLSAVAIATLKFFTGFLVRLEDRRLPLPSFPSGIPNAEKLAMALDRSYPLVLARAKSFAGKPPDQP